MRILVAIVVLGVCVAVTCLLWPTRVGDMIFVLHDHAVTETAANVLRGAIASMWAIAVVAIVWRAQK